MSEQAERVHYTDMLQDLKDSVREFWNENSCGEVYAVGTDLRERLENQARERYVLEPWIHPFADFPAGVSKDVLEIGVGMGADHLEWAKAFPRSLTGIDITDRAISFTADRLGLYGLCSDLRVADAENLPFPNESFDIVYFLRNPASFAGHRPRNSGSPSRPAPRRTCENYDLSFAVARGLHALAPVRTSRASAAAALT